MNRKPEFDDPCKCGHQRYAHVDQRDGCTYACECLSFQVALDYKMLVRVVLSAPPDAREMFVSRDALYDMMELFASQGWTGSSTFMGKAIMVNDALVGSRVAFTQNDIEGVEFL